MKIPSDQIEEKALAGKTKDGRNVVYVHTRGGLHALFAKDENGDIVSIGAAPHKAIAKFLAGKKEEIEWNKDFLDNKDSLEKSENDFFQKLRTVMFMKSAISEPSSVFLVYDVNKASIEVMKKSELEASAKAGQVDKYTLIRDTNLTSKAMPIKDHSDFEDIFRRG